MRRNLAFALLTLFIGGSAWALDREAFTVTHYQLEVQIDRASHVMAVTGQLTLRNDTKLPQKNLTLQVSSSLSWNGVALDRTPLEWIGNDYTSDIDHTGHLSEAIVTLPTALPPSGLVTLDIQYGGTVTPDATRFTRMGAPEQLALRNDWDQISEPFTAIRGLGHVVWYPVSLPAVSMSDGNSVFETISAWKVRHAESQFDAFIRVINGASKLCIAGNAMASACGEFGQTADPRTGGMTEQVSNNLRLTSLAVMVPAFAVADYIRLERPDIAVFHVPDNTSVARDYAAAAESNQPLLGEWLNPATKPAVIIELTDPNANPYQTGSIIFTPLRQSDTATLSLLLMPAQVAARFSSPRPWIEDGLQRFLQAASVERRAGRQGALHFLNEYLPALVKAEESPAPPATATASAPQKSPSDDTLLNTSDEILLRGKGGFVFWMLRDMLGGAVLQRSLAAYRPSADVSPAYLQGLLEDGRKRNLEWLFDDWVYRDRGLPEFRVDSVYARPILEGPNKLALVTVTIENRGGAGAEVPVLVQTPAGERTVRILAPSHQKAVARLQIPTSPTKVVVNDGSIPVSNSTESIYDVPANQEQK